MLIKYYAKNVYGNVLYYPLDPDQAFELNILTGMKTLDLPRREALEALGFKLQEVLPPKSN